MGQLPFERIQREKLVRIQAKTSPSFGKQPTSRSMDELLTYGIVNIDKPSGPTSHQVSAYVQKILDISKSGHSGTLDPKVTGVLPIALGKGTRIVQSLLNAGKEYVCVLHLHQPVKEEKLREVITQQFTGKIKQLPPVKSAVKRQQRYRKIYYFDILEIQEQDVLCVIGCQAGTYIRKLCHDIGEALGVGAHMAQLRRTKAGPFNETTALCTLQDLADAYHYYQTNQDETQLRSFVEPIEQAVAHLPEVIVLDSTVDSICHGATLKVKGISCVDTEIQVGEPVTVKTLKGELVCVGNALLTSKEMHSRESGVAVKSNQVFMPPGTYPKIQR